MGEGEVGSHQMHTTVLIKDSTDITHKYRPGIESMIRGLRGKRLMTKRGKWRGGLSLISSTVNKTTVSNITCDTRKGLKIRGVFSASGQEKRGDTNTISVTLIIT